MRQTKPAALSVCRVSLDLMPQLPWKSPLQALGSERKTLSAPDLLQLLALQNVHQGEAELAMTANPNRDLQQE